MLLPSNNNCINNVNLASHASSLPTVSLLLLLPPPLSSSSFSILSFLSEIEFYAACYRRNGDGSYDAVDAINANGGSFCHGAFQVHDLGSDGAARNTIMAFNGWARGPTDASTSVGIGNFAGNAAKRDWTLVKNAHAYTQRLLFTFVNNRCDHPTTTTERPTTTTPRPTTTTPRPTTTTPRPTTTTTMMMMGPTCPAGTTLVKHTYACDQPATCQVVCTFPADDPRFGQTWVNNMYHCGTRPVSFEGAPLLGYCWDSNGDPLPLTMHQRCVAPTTCD